LVIVLPFFSFALIQCKAKTKGENNSSFNCHNSLSQHAPVLVHAGFSTWFNVEQSLCVGTSEEEAV
jgi:hypothetical protein